MIMPTHIVAVGGFIENEKGQLLLVQAIHRGWEIPGGQVEVGENLIDALVREIREESGIEVAISSLVGVYSNTGVFKWHDGVTDVPTKVMLDFIGKPVGGSLSTSDETRDSGWFPKEQFLDMVTAPAIRVRYQAYRDFAGTPVYMEYRTKPEFELRLSRQV